MIKKRALLFVLLASTCGFFLHGQEKTDKKGKNYTASTIVADNIRFSIRMPAKLIAGNPIRLTTVIENNGKATIECYLPLLATDYHIAIQDSNGKLVPLTRAGKRCMARESPVMLSHRLTTVGPGGKYEEIIDIGRFFDLSESGKYTLSIYRLVGIPESLSLKIRNLTFDIQDPDTPQ